MTRRTNNSRGAALARRLRRGRQQTDQAAVAGARQLPVLQGVTQRCQFLQPQENVLANARRILCESQRVFSYGNAIVMETGQREERRLVTVTNDGHVEASAASLLANLLICELAPSDPEDAPLQYPPPKSFVELLLNSEPTRDELPSIQTYASRPIFDTHFVFRGAGWHEDVGVLVHGPEIEPVLGEVAEASGAALQRLPLHLQRLLGDFCFRSDADVVNAVGALLTGLLPTHFVRTGKGLVLVDGNQPGIGKTLLARVMGVVLDGADPDLIHYTPDDEELAKRICAKLRSRPQSMLLIDNAKLRAGTAISSPVIEANSMAPQISLRILGQSSNLTCPNDLLWAVTMNDTKASPDLVSRGLPIRLAYDGTPADRRFQDGDPIAYASEHRAEILGELAGMVVRWQQAGRPRYDHHHRCTHWGSVIGGILQASGLPEFLTNLSEAAGEFNTVLDELSAVAEAAFGNRGCEQKRGTAEVSSPGQPARQFEAIFRQSGVLKEALDGAKSTASKAMRIGRFLSANVDRTVPIEADGRTGTATLRMALARSKQKLYHFDVQWDEPTAVDQSPTARHPGNLDDGLDLAVAKASTKGAREETNPGEAVPSDERRCDPKQESHRGNREPW